MPRLKQQTSEELLLEMQSEKLRNLYVGLTRAKNHLYLAYIPSKFKQLETSSILDFYFAFTNAEDLTFDGLQQELKKINPTEMIAWFDKIRGLRVEPLEMKMIESIPRVHDHELLFPSSFSYQKQTIPLTSFSSETSSLVLKKKNIQSNEPVGAHVGQLFHEVMDQIFIVGLYRKCTEEKLQVILDRVVPEKFAPMREIFKAWSLAAILNPYPVEGILITLAEIEPKHVFSELEFLFYDKGKLFKGFIDLVFIHNDKIYLIDWKTNLLEGYEPIQMDLEMTNHQYFLQASMYKQSLQKIKHFDHLSFGKAIYVFVRGLHRENKNLGKVIFDPNEVFI